MCFRSQIELEHGLSLIKSEIESFPSVQKVVVHVHVINLDFTFIVQYLFHANCPIYGFF